MTHRRYDIPRSTLPALSQSLCLALGLALVGPALARAAGGPTAAVFVHASAAVQMTRSSSMFTTRGVEDKKAGSEAATQKEPAKKP